jgi:hypothetical protein
MGVFWNNFFKNSSDFSEGNVWCKGGLTHFHKRTPTNPKSVFGHGGLFVILKDMQLFMSKP